MDTTTAIRTNEDPDGGTDWYTDPNAACDACGHGPRWHNDPTGCTRMNASWCRCARVYAATATGPADFTAATR